MAERDSKIVSELRELLGDRDLIELLENTAGCRLYVSGIETLSVRVGEDIAKKLHARFGGGNYVTMPLARELRARHYRSLGFSNAQIARRLGVTERGVEVLFRRLRTEDQRAA
jgi:hypothetical protein